MSRSLCSKKKNNEKCCISDLKFKQKTMTFNFTHHSVESQDQDYSSFISVQNLKLEVLKIDGISFSKGHPHDKMSTNPVKTTS